MAQAYEIISDREARRDYDLRRAGPQPGVFHPAPDTVPAETPGRGGPGYPWATAVEWATAKFRQAFPDGSLELELAGGGVAGRVRLGGGLDISFNAEDLGFASMGAGGATLAPSAPPLRPAMAAVPRTSAEKYCVMGACCG